VRLYEQKTVLQFPAVSVRTKTALQFPAVSARTITALQFPPVPRHNECQLITTKHKVRLWHSSLRLCSYNAREVVPVYKMKAYRGCGGIPPLIPKISSTWRWVVTFTPPVPTEQETGCVPQPVWRLWLWQNSLTADGQHFLCCPTCGLFTKPAELSRKSLD